MNNFFYYSRNPYIENIPRTFNSLNQQLSRTNISSSFNFNSLLNTAQKGINTINQIIPLYKQVKPIYQQAKTSLSSFQKYFKKNVPNRNTTTFYSTFKPSSNTNYYQNKGPSTPYFK